MEDKRLIDILVQRYIDVFNQADFESCADCYRFPLSFVTERGVSVLGTREEFLSMWRRTHAAMVAEGWVCSVLDESSVRLLNTGLAFISVRVTRRRADGSAIETSGGVYTVRRGREGWRIVASVLQDVTNMLRFEN